MSDLGPDLEVLFVQEANGRLDRLVDGAIALERGDRDAELIASLFRDAHTLKGSSAVVGLESITGVAHALEDVLGDLRAGRREPGPADVEAILEAVDAIRGMLPGAAPAPAPTPAPPLGEDVAAPPRATPEPPEPAQPEPASPGPAPVAPPAPDESVTVPLSRLDALVRLAGEAIAQHLRLRHLLTGPILADPEAEATALGLQRSLDALRDQALGSRMTSLAAIAAPLRRAVRDVAAATGRTIDYELSGDRVELDRAVLDGLREPLLHLVRNAADHGIEDATTRAAAGKPPTGTIRVHARRQGPEIVVEVSDDGGGLDLDALRRSAGEPDLDDAQAAALVFRAGLSTAAAITAVSGRGVGLDAVRSSVEGVRGRVAVTSVPGQGTTFTLVVPLTLAVLPCVLVEVAGERYAIPTHATVVLLEDPDAAEVGLEGGRAVWVGGDIVPLADLSTVVGAAAAATGPAIVLDVGAGSAQPRCALRLDAVHGQRDVTVTELGGVVPHGLLVSGASIEPDGSVVLVLDPVALADRVGRVRVPAATRVAAGVADEEAPTSILVVDDALTVRELQRSILARAGYDVRTAADGQDALARLAERRPDLVVTDVEMPVLDGLGLTRAIRASPALASVPVLMVTSRASDADRREGLEAGADAYLVKQDFDETRLLDAVRRLLGDPT